MSRGIRSRTCRAASKASSRASGSISSKRLRVRWKAAAKRPRASRTGPSLATRTSRHIAKGEEAMRVMSRKPPAARRRKASSSRLASAAAFMSVTAKSCGRWLTVAAMRSCRSASQDQGPRARRLHERDEVGEALGQGVGADVRRRTEDVGGVLEEEGVGASDAAFFRARHRVAADEGVRLGEDVAGVLDDRRLDRADVRHDGARPQVRRDRLHQAQDRPNRRRQHDEVGVRHGRCGVPPPAGRWRPRRSASSRTSASS